MADKALSFSLADFFFNDSPDVLTPPSDFQSWIENPKIQSAMGLFGQQLLAAPRAGTEVLSSLDGKRRKVINMTSYNYLGLSTHPEVIQAAKDALDHLRDGRFRRPAPVGHIRPARGVRAPPGRVQAEGRLPAVFQRAGGECRRHPGAPAQGRHVRPGREVPQEPDRRRHAFRGEDALLLPQRSRSSLEAMLEKCKGKRVLVAFEGVYSMDGDLVRLPEILEVCAHYKAATYIDEAHSTLMFGPNGRGVAEHFGLEHEIGVSFGTFSKSFGGVGGFVCSNARIIAYLKGYSSPWNFSCAPSPPVVGGLMKALEVATRDSTPARPAVEERGVPEEGAPGPEAEPRPERVPGDSRSSSVPTVKSSSSSPTRSSGAGCSSSRWTSPRCRRTPAGSASPCPRSSRRNRWTRPSRSSRT